LSDWITKLRDLERLADPAPWLPRQVTLDITDGWLTEEDARLIAISRNLLLLLLDVVEAAATYNHEGDFDWVHGKPAHALTALQAAAEKELSE
jgi:hypothetical protein